MFTRKFWLDALERAIKTFAQFLLTTGAIDPLSADLQTSIQTKLIGAAAAAVVSILTSIVSTSFGRKDSASVIDAKGDDGAVSAMTVAVVALVVATITLLLLIFGAPARV